MPDIGWPEILIIAVVILVLFGTKKMPDAARSLGRSMRIFKTEIKGMHDDDKNDPAPTQPQQLTAGQSTPPGPSVEQTEPATAIGDNPDGR